MKSSFLILGALIFLGPLWASEPEPLSQVKVTPVSGVYNSPLKLEFQIPAAASVRYRFLETSSNQTFALTGPLVLEALAGERRVYTLRLTTNLGSGEALTRDYRYEVVRAVEPVATVQPPPGVYSGSLTIHPNLPPGWSVWESGVAQNFPLTLDVTPGNRRNVLLEARGPRGETVTWPYVVDRRDQEAVAIEVVSPIPGTWANAQPLVVVFRGVDRVLWSYGDSLDFLSAQEYTGPQILDRVGRQSLTVGGRSRIDGRWVEKTVAWSNGTAPSPDSTWPGSGVKVAGLDFPEVPGWSLSWDEGQSWEPSVARHQEGASSVSRKVLEVQVRKAGDISRFVYWMDARKPSAPSLQFLGGWNPLLTFTGANEALHHVVWTLTDGKTLEEPVGLWGPVGAWKVPDGVVAARVIAQTTNGLTGAAGTMGFAETGWSTPDWEPWDQQGPQTDRSLLPLGGKVVPRPGFWPVYEMSDRPDVAEPSSQSPWLEGAFLPTLPWGCDRTFYVRFAWRDAGGLTGPASAAAAVRVDRVPPMAPEALQVGGQVLIKPAEGEEAGTSLFWSVSSDRVTSAETLTFQTYDSALDAEVLRAGAAGKLWFHAKAQDRSGNSGPARLNMALAPVNPDTGASVVQVDPDPQIGDSPVEDGGVYPWPQFRLRALDQGRELWVGVSDQSSVVPSDWKNRLQPWTGILSRSVGRGERRTFLLFWNLKTTAGWAWTQPKTLSLTLDQGPPSVPVAEGWPSSPLGGPWTLNLKPGRSGDSLRYTWTSDGSVPDDPLTTGQPWPGTRTWDTSISSKVVIRVRMAAVSVAGFAMEVPLGDPVTIDRSPPVALNPLLEPFTYTSAPFPVARPQGVGVVRYTMTSNGSLPEIPSLLSPVVPPSGLLLEGNSGLSVLYRFRWRTYSEAGHPGTASDTYAVLVDRTAIAQSSDPKPSVVSSVPVPKLKGLPPTPVSLAAVTLESDWPTGVLRYEVREGVGSPRVVTNLSPVWDKPMVLDGGPGVDRSYAIRLRGFSPEGTPLTEEVEYNVRIDRSIPRAPQYSVLLDLRRPEASLEYPKAGRNPEETLYYRWSWECFPQSTGGIDWRSLTTEVPLFTAPEGNLTRLKVQAYLRDEAGNEGPVTEKTVLIDQNVVYLATQGSGDGSRNQPAGTVVDAVEHAQKEGKGILFVLAGTYPVSRTIDLGGIRVFGGWAADLWEATPSPGRSLWTAGSAFTGSAFLESGEKDWSLSRIDLTSLANLPRLVLVRGAAVSIKNSSWNWGLAQGGWDQVGGSLDLSDVTASFTPEPRAVFLELRNLEANVRNFNLSLSQNQGGLIFSLKTVQALFQDLVVVSKKASGYDAVLSASDSRLTFDNTRILAGEGASRATAFTLKETEAVFWNTEIALYGTLANTGFQATGGKLELQKSSLSLLRGEEFNQGLVLDHCEAILRTFQMKLETGAYQGGFSVDGGSLTLASAKIQLAGGGQRAWGAQFLDSTLVNLSDVSWVLTTKTNAELWTTEKAWLPGSTVVGSTTSGW